VHELDGVLIMALPVRENHELRFLALDDGSEGYAFPCDPAGSVELDGLTEQERIDYLYARAVVGREVAPPSVMPMPPHPRG
jgi:hypothetical protein